MYGAIPSDYEGDTVESDDKIDTGNMNNMHDEPDNIVVLDDTAVIIVGNEVQEAIYQHRDDENNSEDASSSRRWKKAEPFYDSTFSPFRRRTFHALSQLIYFSYLLTKTF